MTRDEQIFDIAVTIRTGTLHGANCAEIAEVIYENNYRKASEVAKEILEDIEENYADYLFDGSRNIIVITEKDFAELKKKYTEVTNDERE